MGDLNPNKEIKIAYTHFHADHTLGAGAFKENFQMNGVIGHRDLEAEFENFMGIKRTLIGERSQKMFGLILKDKNFGICLNISNKYFIFGFFKKFQNIINIELPNNDSLFYKIRFNFFFGNF